MYNYIYYTSYGMDGELMATKSFLKSVNIRGDKQIRRFMTALEKAEQSHDVRKEKNPTAYEVSTEQLGGLLSKYRKA